VSFSREIKDELARIFPQKRCCRLALLTALAGGEGRFIDGARGRMLEIRMQNLAVARLLLRLLKEMGDVQSIWEIRESRRFRKAKEFVIHLIPGDSLERLARQSGLSGTAKGIPPGLVRRKCCRRSFLRGAFLASGSVNPPERSYHLEIVEHSMTRAKGMQALLGSLEIPARTAVRSHNICIYIKKADDIARLLNLMGATHGQLQFEQSRVVKDTKNDVQRLVNCEAANLAKITNAAVRQGEIIRFLCARLGSGKIPEGLREVARLRLKNPEASLREIGEMAHPPLSKSSVSKRLALLEEMAVRLRDKGTL
jgi:DNA-binding protein WhiA